jgi:hypothetical protein
MNASHYESGSPEMPLHLVIIVRRPAFRSFRDSEFPERANAELQSAIRRRMPTGFVIIGIEDRGTQSFFFAAWWVWQSVCRLRS